MSIRTFLSASVSIFCASLLFRCDANSPESELSKNIEAVQEITADEVLNDIKISLNQELSK